MTDLLQSSLVRFGEVGTTSHTPKFGSVGSCGDLNFGDIVRSRAVGGRPEFTGIVTFGTVNGYGETYFHVRDEWGQYWHWSRGDLEIVEDET